MSLDPVIKLYRLAGKPPPLDGAFTGEIPFSKPSSALIHQIVEHPTFKFLELSIDDEEIFDFDNIPNEGSEIKFVLKLPTSSANRFYVNIEELCKTPSISRGDLPKEYYIINTDFSNIPSNITGKEPEQITTLKAICRLIKELSVLAHYHDGKTDIGHYQLVFVQPANNQSQPVVVETKVEAELLLAKKPDISIIESLNKSSAKADPHYNSQLGIFSVSLVEFIGKKSVNQSEFSYLIHNWKDFVELYQQNLSTYLSGFAFHKAKLEVANAEVSITEQYSKLLSDITGKLFSIPISLSAIIVMVDSDSLFNSTILVFGLLLVAFVIAGTVDNQQQQLIRIRHAKDIVLDSLEGKKKSYPVQLEDALKEMKKGLKKSAQKLCYLLWGFRFLAWLPVITATIIYTFLYSNFWD